MNPTKIRRVGEATDISSKPFGDTMDQPLVRVRIHLAVGSNIFDFQLPPSNSVYTYGSIFTHAQTLGLILPPQVTEITDNYKVVDETRPARKVDPNDPEPLKFNEIQFLCTAGLNAPPSSPFEINQRSAQLRGDFEKMKFPTKELAAGIAKWVKEMEEKGIFFNPSIIKRLHDKVFLPWIYKDKFKSKPHGVLFYGPPGTGKTVLASLFEVFFNSTNPNGEKSASRFSKGKVGETQQIMRQEVSICAQEPNQDFVIIVDEFDTLGGDRSGSKEGGQSFKADFLNQFLSLIDENDNLLLIACTNFKEKLDSAILRDGRLDIHIYVPPLSPEERYNMLENKIKISVKEEKRRADCIYLSKMDVEPFIQMTINFTAGQYIRLLKEIHDVRVLTNEAYSGALLLRATKQYLKDQERPNLTFNELQLATDQHLFENVENKLVLYKEYKDSLSDYLQQSKNHFFSLKGPLSGRFILGFDYRAPFIELDTCQCIVPQTSTEAIGFNLLSSYDIPGLLKTNVYHMLLPIVQQFGIQYIQVINNQTVPQESDNFEQFLRGKLTECEESTVPSLIVIFIDELVGSKPSFTNSSSTTQSLDSKNQNTITNINNQQQTHQNVNKQTNDNRQSNINSTSNTTSRSIEKEISAINQRLYDMSKTIGSSQSQGSTMKHEFSNETSWNFETSNSSNQESSISHGWNGGKVNNAGKKANSKGFSLFFSSFFRHFFCYPITTTLFHTPRFHFSLLLVKSILGILSTADMSGGLSMDSSQKNSFGGSTNLERGFNFCTTHKTGSDLKNEIEKEKQVREMRASNESKHTSSDSKIENIFTKLKENVVSVDISQSKLHSQDQTISNSVTYSGEVTYGSSPFNSDILIALNVLLKSYSNQCSIQEKQKPYIAFVVRNPLTYMWVQIALDWRKLPGSMPTDAALHKEMMTPTFLTNTFSKCAFSLKSIIMKDEVREKPQLLTPDLFLIWITNVTSKNSEKPKFIFSNLKKLILKGPLRFDSNFLSLKKKFVENFKVCFPRLEIFGCSDRTPSPWIKEEIPFLITDYKEK